MENRDFHGLRENALEYGGEYALGHSLRLIGLVKEIAQGRPYNEDVILFSAYVHDFGGYPKFLEAGKDHVVRSMEVVEQYMAPFSFTEYERELVLETISKHHSPTTPNSLEAILFRDADVLDFLGFIGVARDLMRVEKDFDRALGSIKKHRAELPSRLHEAAAKELGMVRLKEMDDFLERIQSEHFAYVNL